MKETLFDSYGVAANNLARRLCVFDRVDVLANDYDDYKSILQLESVKLQKSFRDLHGFNVKAENRYVHKGLWLYCLDIYRKRKRRYTRMVCHESVLLFGAPPASTEKREMEYRIEAKHAVKLLEKFLTHEDMKLLWRWALSDGRVEAGIQPGMSKAKLKYRIRSLKAKAKGILKK